MFLLKKETGMRQFYTLPALKIVLRLNKNKESIKIVFWDLYNICLPHITQIVS